MKHRRFFAVYVHNTETGHLRITNIFDNEIYADAEVKCLIEKFSNNGFLHHYEIYTKPVHGVRGVISLSDVALLKACEHVADCLYLAEYSIKKHGINKRNSKKFKYWYNLAKKFAIKSADILDNINEL